MNTCISPAEIEVCSDCENIEYCARRLIEKYGCKELRSDYLNSWKVFVDQTDLAPTLRDAYAAAIDAYNAKCGPIVTRRRRKKPETFFNPLRRLESVDWVLLGILLASAYLRAFPSEQIDARNLEPLLVISAAALLYRQW